MLRTICKTFSLAGLAFLGIWGAWVAAERAPSDRSPRLLPDDATVRPLDPRDSADGSTLRQTSHFATATLLAVGANGATPVEIDEITTQNVNDIYHWKTQQGTEPIRLDKTTFTLTLSGNLGADNRLYLRLNANQFLKNDGKTIVPGSAVFFLSTLPPSLPITLPPGRWTLTPIVANSADFAVDQAIGRPVTVIVPETPPGIPLSVGAAFLSSVDTLSPKALVSDEAKVLGGYLRVIGKSTHASAPDLRFLLFHQDPQGSTNFYFQSNLTPSPDRLTAPPPTDVDSVVTLPLPTIRRGSRGRLLMYTSVGDSHVFASDPVKFIVVQDRKPAPPTIEKQRATSKFDSEKGAHIIAAEDKKTNATFDVTGNSNIEQDPDIKAGSRIVIYQSRDNGPARRLSLAKAITDAAGTWTAPIPIPDDGRYQYWATTVQGDLESDKSAPLHVIVATTGPKIESVSPTNKLFSDERIVVTIRFDSAHRLNATEAENEGNFHLRFVDDIQKDEKNAPPKSASYNPADNSVTLSFDDVTRDGGFSVFVKKELPDSYGNSLVLTKAGVDEEITGFSRNRLLNTASVRPGINATTGKYVQYPEFTPRRELPSGFNPNDKVETRVARLYYYRDAHRVAQIVNRKAKSHNRQGVDMARQLADKARSEASAKSAQRMQAERDAIAKAQASRQLENQLKSAENSLKSTLQIVQDAQRNPNPDPMQNASDLAQLQAAAKAFSDRISQLQGEIQLKRDAEVQANNLVQELAVQEKLALEDQFRREVAAAHQDPDTYAEGVPDSKDPVEQVSVSVIGEGLIQLRGPLKGVNMVRTMIDQMDAPVGQVRVGVHTVQINGERADRMEVVADQVQKYIDQARFLTMQSSELLRRSVVQVASLKAEEARGMYVGDTQEDRDQRYLHAFFGRDFIDELRSIDSEFLRTGNKLLSLHSMDTTSLSSALTLMALAKNDTRQQILETFEQLCQGELPRAEESYLQSGMACPPGKHPMKCKQPRLCLKGQNGRFESLRGFFNAEIAHGDTMTPLQREFLRLAQIFKSRLITELEYKQRVMERSVIEVRNEDRTVMEKKARDRESNAEQKLEAVRGTVAQEQAAVRKNIERLTSETKTVNDAAQSMRQLRDEVREITWDLVENAFDGEHAKELESHVKSLGEDEASIRLARSKYEEMKRQSISQLFNNACHVEWDAVTGEFSREWNRFIGKPVDDKGRNYDKGFRNVPNANDGKESEKFVDLIRVLKAGSQRNKRFIDYVQSNLQPVEQETLWLIKRIEQLRVEADKAVDSPKPVVAALKIFCMSGDAESLADALQKEINDILDNLRRLHQHAADPALDVGALYRQWFAIRNTLREYTRGDLRATADKISAETDDSIDRLATALAERESAQRNWKEARQPLDHKKFLDMLIDETEEKYIELLEGTRAHTANIDNYIKRVTTALDDDFNTQFYFPVFRNVRESSQSYDVQFGQTETTTVLANNREFAKVSPKASMEFDLPKRDILLTEAISGAKAMMNDVGALANDPTFLAMAKMKAPNSTSSPAPGTTAGVPVVRGVLPGLASETTEQMLSQNANGGVQFGSNLENLIPDPAIYKFETGTGFEIRPVIQPDGQAVVFNFNYLYSTQIREPVRADEKHLGRIKQHHIHTDVQLSNFELREVSRYVVALKAARTAKGVPLLEDIPLAGVLFRPLPSDEKSLQQNVVLAQATIFPTLFDLMGLRWAPAIADLDALRLSNDEFTVRGRNRMIKNRVFDFASEQVDEFLRVPEGNRRPDLYRSQETVPHMHPNGYNGPGLNQIDSELQEGYQPQRAYPSQRYQPSENREGTPRQPRDASPTPLLDGDRSLEAIPPGATSRSSRSPTGLRSPPSELRSAGAHGTIDHAARPASPPPVWTSPAGGIRPAGAVPAPAAVRPAVGAPTSARTPSETWRTDRQVRPASAEFDATAPPAEFPARQEVRRPPAAGPQPWRLPATQDEPQR